MPSTPNSDAAAVAADKEKPFPFLLLPAELRNHIYENLLIDSKPKIKLRHNACAADSPISTTGGGFFAFTAVCKQIRKEFQPMLANSYETIEIRSKYMFKFFDTFSARPFRPKFLHIRVLLEDVTEEFKCDMRSFFDFRFSAPRGYKCYITGPPWFASTSPRVFDHVKVLQTLLHAGNISRAFRADLKSGYISNVTYELKSDHLQLWTLTISKHTVGLQNSEIEALTRYCEHLCFRKEPSEKAINIKVQNHRGRVFEEYMWVRTYYMKHRDGVDQLDWECRLWEKIGKARWKIPGLPLKPTWLDW